MSYTFSKNNPLNHELKRTIHERIDDSIAQLENREGDMNEAVHELRKNMKKIRAVLRLMRYNIKNHQYIQLNIFSRDLARQFAPYREAEVHSKTLDKLMNKNDMPDITGKVKEIIQSNYEYTNQQLKKQIQFLAKTKQELIQSKHQLEDIEIENRDFELVKDGLKKVYRQGRKALKTAKKTPDSENLHEWRKRVKYLMYQIRLLKKAWPKVMKAYNKSLDKLSDYLGEEHDLAELKKHMLKSKHLSLIPENEKIEITAKIDKKRSKIQSKSWKIGEKFYLEKPRDFADRISLYWKITV